MNMRQQPEPYNNLNYWLGIGMTNANRPFTQDDMYAMQNAYNRMPPQPDSDLPGRWLALWARRQATLHGTLHAAKMMRKRGYPISVALMLLVGRV